jgi:hypothetical protein
MFRPLVLSLILSLTSGIAFGFETDNFTRRYEPLADARAPLNAEVNRQLREIVKTLNNQSMPTCVDGLAMDAARMHLSGWLIGKLESYSANNDDVPKHKPTSPHIYSERSLKGKVRAFAATLSGMQVSVNINGNYFGADKFGHFFDDGLHSYFAKRQSNDPRKSLEDGVALEKDVYGLKTTGVYSYADLAAENDGRRFWESLTEGSKPYLKCTDGKWSTGRSFDWADYVTAAWDEGNNCSRFTPDTVIAVNKRVAALEKEAAAAGRAESYTCPVMPAKCVGLKARYAEVADIVLHPKCLNVKSAAGGAVVRPGGKPAAKPSPTRRGVQ